MKNLKLLSIVKSLIVLGIIFTGCRKDDTVNPDKPSITVSSPAEGSSIISGENIVLSFNASATQGLKRIIIKYTPAGGNATTVFDTTLNSLPLSMNFSKTYKSGAVGNESYTITVNDNKDVAETKTVNVKSITGFTDEKLGTIYHIKGSLAGAYDLIGDRSRAEIDADVDKDMKNYDDVGLFTGSFLASNQTKFVKVLGFNYSSGTKKDAITAYEAGSPSSSVAAPIANEIYIAKLRGTAQYVIIKIISKDILNNDCNCLNTGKLYFAYKRTL